MTPLEEGSEAPDFLRHPLAAINEPGLCVDTAEREGLSVVPPVEIHIQGADVLRLGGRLQVYTLSDDQSRPEPQHDQSGGDVRQKTEAGLGASLHVAVRNGHAPRPQTCRSQSDCSSPAPSSEL